MTAILSDAAPLQLWTDLVREAESTAGTRLDEELESYLVFLLIAHTRDVHLHGNAMAFDYLLARAAGGARRKEELRQVGDRCLLLAGFYPEQAGRRMVTVDYFLALGSGAYDELSATLRAGMAELFRRLARAYARRSRRARDRTSGVVHETNASTRRSARRYRAPRAPAPDRA